MVESNFAEKKKWLEIFSDPWDTVELYWRETHINRTTTYKLNKYPFQIFTDWPILKNDKGYRLVSNLIYSYFKFDTNSNQFNFSDQYRF